MCYNLNSLAENAPYGLSRKLKKLSFELCWRTEDVLLAKVLNSNVSVQQATLQRKYLKAEVFLSKISLTWADLQTLVVQATAADCSC